MQQQSVAESCTICSPRTWRPVRKLLVTLSCTTDSKEGYVLRKLQCRLISMESWCERWNI